MNISQPVSSEVDFVDFTFLSPAEIKAISVKRIENEMTFDTMKNPAPSGLYDPALGAWGDIPCSTCHLNRFNCPGHPGHIELVGPVYHAVFFNQAYQLLRAVCVYCKGFRLSAAILHKYTCQLRLLQHGLVREAQIVDAIGDKTLSALIPDSVLAIFEDSEAEDESTPQDDLARKREKFVRYFLREGRKTRRDINNGKHEGIGRMRYEVIKAFLSQATKTRECSSCTGISPLYAKEQSDKIFEKRLSEKEMSKMAQRNLKRGSVKASVHRKKKGEDHAENRATDQAVDENSQSNQDPATPDVQTLSTIAQKAYAPTSQKRYMSPAEVRARLIDLFEKEQDLVSLLYNAKPVSKKSQKTTAEMFFVTMLLVSPNRYRPENRTSATKTSEAPENRLYKNVLLANSKISLLLNATSETSMASRLHNAWLVLQQSVNTIFDSSLSPIRGRAALGVPDGIKQKLEKKEGLFRNNLMGKRVNYCGRSVISPDPNIATGEIGVPLVFAQKLTYPEPVASYNVDALKQAVINGANKWPGANAIENENGYIVRLDKKSDHERLLLARQLTNSTTADDSEKKTKRVHRHMKNGDVVLMNRQPTLHKPSLMGHRVRVLPLEKTIRMHYANCNSYNADFDGDEMNLHFPQNELARSEALQVADTDNQYVSGTQGKPLRGLIQDHLSISITLCNLDTVFNQSDYNSLIYAALRPESGHVPSHRLQLVPPAIVKPVPRWTGKQVITTILKNLKPRECVGLTMQGDTQLKASQWGPNSEEGVVRIIDDELISGILDKSQIGPSSGGMVHAAHEAFGPAIANKLLSCLGRLLTRLLYMKAFSCGMDDLKLTCAGEKARRQALKQAEKLGLEIASDYVSLSGNVDPTNKLLLSRLEEVLRDDKKQEGLDLLMNQGTKDVTDSVQKACIPDGLEKAFPKNQMQAMTTSGAKGSRVNASLISCNLGQQILEGRRVPLMVSGKTLPCFKPFETNVESAGYISSRFLTGIRPHEYYFHHMAGREGLIDTAVKTSRSGYLQRCIIKSLEGLVVAYDASVRDSDGSIIQFLYGEDGIDVAKQRYLTDFGFTLENETSNIVQLQNKKMIETLTNNRAPFLKYMKKAVKYAKAKNSTPRDPLLGLVNPAANTFAISEAFYEAMSLYIKENKSGLIKDKNSKNQSQRNATINRKNAECLFALKYQRSLVEPGEAVGIVAGQSVGEPSTQMTLNTFHLAGHAASNVTQGIPRLREILMTASVKISTPSMTLYPLSHISAEDGTLLAKKLSEAPLGSIIDRVIVEETVGSGVVHTQAKAYKIKIQFFPPKEYSPALAITVSDVMRVVEKNLVGQIVTLTRKAIAKRKGQATEAVPQIGVISRAVEIAPAESSSKNHGSGEKDSDGEDDGDATGTKQRLRRSDAVSYSEDEDDGDDVIQQTQDAADASEERDDEETNDLSGGTAMNSDDENGDDPESSRAQGETTARAERIKENYEEVIDFQCDEKKGGWCSITIELDLNSPKLLMLNLVKNAVGKTMLRKIRGVDACTYVQGAIQVSGSNIRAMQSFADRIDVDRIETNDIAAVLAHFGVEACRTNIVRELSGIFGGHGISVDNRHLGLIADFMTRNGGFTAFNRTKLANTVSPFTKMSFETTLAFLRDAVLDGDWDDLSTPSGRLVMGRVGKLGTGSFNVLVKAPVH